MVVILWDTAPAIKVTLRTGHVTGYQIREAVYATIDNIGMVIDDFYIHHNGKLLKNEDVIHTNVHVVPRILGGKGGFGSMLRAIGAQIEKTTNREACRDLSGRRLRDINEEKRLKKWISEQADRERDDLNRKRKKIEKLRSEPKHQFNDSNYDKERSQLTENVSDAVEYGLMACSSKYEIIPSSNGSATLKNSKKKLKGSLWLDGEELELSNDDEEDDCDNAEDNEERQDRPLKKQRTELSI